MEVVPQPAWEELLERLAQGGTSIFIGTTDVGKSTLVRWLIYRLVAGGRAASLVDSDIGQSSLCIPGTVGMTHFKTLTEFEAYSCRLFNFLGTANPAKTAFPLIETTGRMAAAARKESRTILVDTTRTGKRPDRSRLKTRQGQRGAARNGCGSSDSG